MRFENKHEFISEDRNFGKLHSDHSNRNLDRINDQSLMQKNKLKIEHSNYQNLKSSLNFMPIEAIRWKTV
jgi:hypothetical protein